MNTVYTIVCVYTVCMYEMFGVSIVRMHVRIGAARLGRIQSVVDLYIESVITFCKRDI